MAAPRHVEAPLTAALALAAQPGLTYPRAPGWYLAWLERRPAQLQLLCKHRRRWREKSAQEQGDAGAVAACPALRARAAVARAVKALWALVAILSHATRAGSAPPPARVARLKRCRRRRHGGRWLALDLLRRLLPRGHHRREST